MQTDKKLITTQMISYRSPEKLITLLQVYQTDGSHNMFLDNGDTNFQSSSYILKQKHMRRTKFIGGGGGYHS